MRDIGADVGLKVRAVLSDMDQPLGLAVGNALEVAEAVETLKGNGPRDLLEVALKLGSHLLVMSGTVETPEEGVVRLNEVLNNGRGLDLFRRFVENQGGDPDFIDDLTLLPQAPVRVEVGASRSGYVSSVDAEALGRASVEIGAGRQVKGAVIDHAVGFILQKKPGDLVKSGESLLTIHASSTQSVRAIIPALEDAFVVGESRPQLPPTVLEVVS
jgi:pyrimidine-nucleoside phosphorylase